jgi:hypothetical protein
MPLRTVSDSPVMMTPTKALMRIIWSEDGILTVWRCPTLDGRQAECVVETSKATVDTLLLRPAWTTAVDAIVADTQGRVVMP